MPHRCKVEDEPPEEGTPEGMHMQCYQEQCSVEKVEGWLCGRVPSARAGMAVAVSPDNEALIYGGAR